MKKTVTQTDGTVIEIEGTAEEIAEWEKSQGPDNDSRRNENKNKGKRILNEDLVAEMIQKEMERHEDSLPHARSWLTSYTPVVGPYNPYPYWGHEVICGGGTWMCGAETEWTFTLDNSSNTIPYNQLTEKGKYNDG